jgi:hypothetical protein
MDNNELMTSMMTSCSLLGRFMRFGAEVLNLTKLEDAAPMIASTLEDLNISGVIIVNHEHFKLCQKIHRGVRLPAMKELIQACRPGHRGDKIKVQPQHLMIKGQYCIFAMDLEHKNEFEIGVYQDNMALFTDLVDKFITNLDQLRELNFKASEHRQELMARVGKLEDNIAGIHQQMIQRSQNISLDLLHKIHILIPKFDQDMDQEEQIIHLLEKTANEYTEFF